MTSPTELINSARWLASRLRDYPISEVREDAKEITAILDRLLNSHSPTSQARGLTEVPDLDSIPVHVARAVIERHRNARRRKGKMCPNHPERPVHAGGVCSLCYNRKHRDVA